MTGAATDAPYMAPGNNRAMIGAGTDSEQHRLCGLVALCEMDRWGDVEMGVASMIAGTAYLFRCWIEYGVPETG